MKTHLNTPKTLSRFLPLVIFMSICGSSVLSLFAPRLDAQQYLASPVSLAGPTGLTVVRSGEYNNVVSWHAVPGATAPAAPCALAQANFQAAGVTLTARGVHYWLVVTTSGAATQTGTTAVWWNANLAQAPFNLNDGNGWQAFPDGAPGGCMVQ